jgi:hypothetical protein
MLGDDCERQPPRPPRRAATQSKNADHHDYREARNGITDRERVADSQRGK